VRLESVLFFGDVHRPFHDEKAWRLMLRVGRAVRPKHLVCIGDYMDCYSVSSHSKDPSRVALLKEEVEDARRGLDQLDKLGASNKLFIAGNHSHRIERMIQDQAPQLFGMVSVEDLLQLKARGWSFTPYKKATKLGRIFLTHDVGASGRNATFKALDTFSHSVVTGHAHRLQYIVEGDATGEQRVSAQFGWLGNIDQIDYMHAFNAKKNWSLGFGLGALNPRTGIVYLQPVPIVKVGKTYTCVAHGVYYEEK
jgi:predicted phosphodiesterase